MTATELLRLAGERGLTIEIEQRWGGLLVSGPEPALRELQPMIYEHRDALETYLAHADPVRAAQRIAAEARR